MMRSLGNMLFRVRNILFPVLYLTLFIGRPPAGDTPAIALIAGTLVVLSGQGIRILTVGLDYIVRGGRQRQVYASRLVQSGLFAHCRNPLYLGNLMMIAGFGIVAGNLLYLTLILPLFFFFYACIIVAEEHYLQERFGEEYRQYCVRTPRLLPETTGLAGTLRAFPFNWRRVLVKEYSTICITLLLLILLWARQLNHTLTDWLITACAVALTLLACAGIRALKKSGKLSAGPSS